MCSPNRYRFSRSTFLATEQIQIFQEHLLFGYPTDTDFSGAPFQLPNRYRFSRSIYFLATEQIPIFQEHLFSYQTDNNFPGSFIRISTNRQVISRKVPPPNRYFRFMVFLFLFHLKYSLQLIQRQSVNNFSSFNFFQNPSTRFVMCMF